MNKKTKVLIVVGASIATSLAFILPFLQNKARYNAYILERGERYLKEIEVKGPRSGWSTEDLLEIGAMGGNDTNMELCLNRYKDENHPFATALTACKQEVLLEQ
jgi:hypothetical protein